MLMGQRESQEEERPCDEGPAPSSSLSSSSSSSSSSRLVQEKMTASSAPAAATALSASSSSAAGSNEKNSNTDASDGENDDDDDDDDDTTVNENRGGRGGGNDVSLPLLRDSLRKNIESKRSSLTPSQLEFVHYILDHGDHVELQLLSHNLDRHHHDHHHYADDHYHYADHDPSSSKEDRYHNVDLGNKIDPSAEAVTDFEKDERCSNGRHPESSSAGGSSRRQSVLESRRSCQRSQELWKRSSRMGRVLLPPSFSSSSSRRGRSRSTSMSTSFAMSSAVEVAAAQATREEAMTLEKDDEQQDDDDEEEDETSGEAVDETTDGIVTHTIPLGGIIGRDGGGNIKSTTTPAGRKSSIASAAGSTSMPSIHEHDDSDDDDDGIMDKDDLAVVVVDTKTDDNDNDDGGGGNDHRDHQRDEKEQEATMEHKRTMMGRRSERFEDYNLDQLAFLLSQSTSSSVTSLQATYEEKKIDNEENNDGVLCNDNADNDGSNRDSDGDDDDSGILPDDGRHEMVRMASVSLYHGQGFEVGETLLFDRMDKHEVPQEQYDPWNFQEVDEDGHVRHDVHILGTSHSDVEAHPHVLSPPMMHSLQPFLPLSQQGASFWLKYSLVRDGASLATFLQRLRGCATTIMAVETVDGDVFGAFCSHAWAVDRRGRYFGTGETFLWRLQHSRAESYEGVGLLEQAHRESALEVFGHGHQYHENDFYQFCRTDKIALGGGVCAGPRTFDRDLETKTTNTATSGGGPVSLASTTYQPQELGFALAFENGSLMEASSSACLTFHSPPLAKNHTDGSKFEVVNVEVWSLTPCFTEREAQLMENRHLFLKRHATM